VDDNQTNRRVLSKLLRSCGVTAACASCGSEGLAELEDAGADNRRFDFVLVDCQMAGMNGFEFAQAVRSRCPERPPIIMMLSSDCRPGSGLRCEEVGVRAFLTKPVLHDELLNCLRRVLAGGVADQPTPASPSGPTASAVRSQPAPAYGGKALVAEDTPINQVLARKMLEKHGYEVTIANDGNVAVELSAAIHFDLVLMDVQMPNCDGWSATRTIRLREQESGAHLPIIAMTAHAMDGDAAKCLASGMDAYLSKPMRESDLLRVIRAFATKPPRENVHPPQEALPCSMSTI
jgi:CheY-like chemotaxis protein